MPKSLRIPAPLPGRLASLCRFSTSAPRNLFPHRRSTTRWTRPRRASTRSAPGSGNRAPVAARRAALGALDPFRVCRDIPVPETARGASPRRNCAGSRPRESGRAGRRPWPATRSRPEIGGAVTRGARALRTSDGRIGSAGRKLGKLGGAVRRFGGKLNEGGNAAAEIFAGVGRLTRALRGNDQTGLGLLDPPEEPEPKAPRPAPQTLRQSPARRLPRPAKEEQTPRPSAPEAAPEALDEPPAPSPSPSPPPTARSCVGRASGSECPGSSFPRSKRSGSGPEAMFSWPLIFEICGWREWTTPAELARWFSMHHRSLVKRHLGPMTKGRPAGAPLPGSPEQSQAGVPRPPERCADRGFGEIPNPRLRSVAVARDLRQP